MRKDAPIRRYIDDCKLLRRDLQHAVRDLQFRQGREARKGTIIYAVDFSEIHGYAVTGATAPEFGILGDDERVAEAMQAVAFGRLFFGQPERLVLLKPYALELRAFLIRERAHRRDSALEHLLLLQREQEGILRMPEFRDIARIVDHADEETRPLSDEEQDRLASFLEEHAGPLVALANASMETDASVLVRRLFSARRFQNLEELLPGLDAPEGEHDEDLYEFLRSTRRGKPDAASLLDAVALMLLKRANDALRDQNAELHLVTRSSAMHQLAERFGEDEIPWLRHPRIFSVLYTTDGLPPGHALHKLQGRLDTVELFLNSVGMQELDSLEQLPNPAFLKALLHKVQEDWKSSTALAASLATGTHPGAPVPGADSRGAPRQPEVVRRLFSLIRDRKQFRDLLFDRLGQVEATLEREHEIFGLALSSLDVEETDSIASRLAPEYYQNKSVLRTTSQGMPYSLQFYTDDARKLLSRLEAEGGTYRWENVLTFFREGFSADSDYERLLAMASILGVLSKWGIAEQYCARALEVATESGTEAHEGHFFLAVCCRKHRTSVERHVRGLELLDRAAEIKRRWKRDPEETDPRYLKEKGTQLLLLHMYFSDAASRLDVPSAAEGLRLLHEAEKHCENDESLRLQILNNRLWYNLEVLGDTDAGSASHLYQDYRAVLALQESMQPDPETWPPSVVDTLVWARYRICGFRDADDAAEMVSMLEHAVNSHELEEKEKKRIRARLGVIKRAAHEVQAAPVPVPVG
jgi:hypothetical protein